MAVQPLLIDGQWRPSAGTQTFQARNPATKGILPESYPVSPWSEIESALRAAARAYETVRGWPGERFAAFLERFAVEIEQNAEAIVAAGHLETALPISPRLKDGELPRTTNQLRQAANAAREDSWRLPVINKQANIRSMYGSIGPVVVGGKETLTPVEGEPYTRETLRHLELVSAFPNPETSEVYCRYRVRR